MTVSPLFDVIDGQVDEVAVWVTEHPSAWPLYGRLWAWCVEHGCPPVPEDPTDRELFTILHRAVAARIVAQALDNSGWTYEQLTLTGTTGAKTR